MTKTACRSPTWWLRHNGGERRTIQWAAVLCQEQKWSILRGHSKKSPERRRNLSSTALSFVLISKQKNIVFYTHTCSCFSLEQQTLILILICTKLAPCLPYTKPNHIHAHVRQPGWQAPRRKTRQAITGSCNISDSASDRRCLHSGCFRGVKDTSARTDCTSLPTKKSNLVAETKRVTGGYLLRTVSDK